MTQNNMSSEDDGACKNQPFFEALTQLIKTHEVDDQMTIIDGKRLCFQSDINQSFPVSDIAAIEQTENTLKVVCRFLGLYGVGTPLPAYFNKYCEGDEEQSEVVRSFLDLFNHRIYALYFMAQQAFVPENCQGGTLPFMVFLKAMSGQLVRDDLYGLSHCIGQGNLNGLYALIHYHVGSLPVQVVSSVLCWTTLAGKEASSLRSRPKLGDMALLGSRLLTNTTQIKVQVGPISMEQALQLRYRSSCYDKLKKDITDYLQGELECQIDILIEKNPGVMALDNQSMYLGLNARLNGLG